MSLARGEADHVQHAVARHDVGDARRTEEESKRTAALFLRGDPGMRSTAWLPRAAGGGATCRALFDAGRRRHVRACRGAGACGRSRGSPAATRASFDRHSFTGLAEQAAIARTAAAAEPAAGAAGGPSSRTMRGRGRNPAGTGRGGRGITASKSRCHTT